MKRRNKIILIFSIVYWLLIFLGIALMSLAFSKVHIGTYGLRVNYFSSSVDQLYYTPGLYYKNVGYYFVTYPSTKQYVIDQKVRVINNDLQAFQVIYSICYRINPTKIYSMYNSLAMTYQSRLIAIINNLVSSYYKQVGQANSRVSAQGSIVNKYNSVWKSTVDSVFGGGVIVQAIWIDQVSFSQLQGYYQKAYQYSTSSNQAFIQTQVDLSIAKLEVGNIQFIKVKALQSTIQNRKAAYLNNLQLGYRSSYNSQILQQQIQFQTSQMKLSGLYNVSRVFNYYSPSRLIFMK